MKIITTFITTKYSSTESPRNETILQLMADSLLQRIEFDTFLSREVAARRSSRCSGKNCKAFGALTVLNICPQTSRRGFTQSFNLTIRISEYASNVSDHLLPYLPSTANLQFGAMKVIKFIKSREWNEEAIRIVTILVYQFEHVTKSENPSTFSIRMVK